MSAKQDKSQKIAFVYSNLYEIYRKGKSAALASGVPAETDSVLGLDLSVSSQAPVVIPSGRVLKAKDLRPGQVQSLNPASPQAPVAKDARTSAEIRPFAPIELLGKRVPKPEVLKTVASNPAIDELKGNLKTLNDLHSRLKFLLQELEDLVE
jgi:hypothetical protein